MNEKVELVLSDDTDDANGSATVLPYPTVRAYVTAPDDLSFLAEHQYWIYELIAHELTHIVHLDTTGNVAKIINTILGRTWMPNQFQSRWFIEGLAVEVESRISLGGRARSRLVDMVFRSEAIEDDPVRLDQALSGPYRWPQGNSWYLHGGRFLSYVALRFGHEKLREVSLKYGGTLVPYGMNRIFKEVTGVSYDDVWADFQAALREEYAQDLAKVLESPIVEGKALTSRGQRNYNPRYTPDGRIFYFAESFSTIPALRVIEDGKDRELDKISSQGQMSTPAEDGTLVFSQNEVWKAYYSFQDLFHYDYKRRSATRLTEGVRARDPAVFGGYVYFVQNLGVRTKLVRARLDGKKLGAIETVWDPGDTWQMYAPRISPNGERIALSVFRPPGQRDIAVLDLSRCEQGGEAVARGESLCASPYIEWATDDEALDGGPTFSPDGLTLYFHSARSDIYNIYAYSLVDTSLSRVTNVMTGAFSPDVSPDGKRMVYVHYSTKGYDIYEMPLEPERFVRVVDAPRKDPMGVVPGSLPATALDEPARLPSQDYNAWKTLLPRQWIVLPSADALGSVLSLAVKGQDPLQRHVWTASVGIGLVSQDLNYALTYQNRQLYPLLSVSTSRSIQSAPTPARINGASVFTAERAHRVDLDISIPLVRALWQMSFDVGYFFENRERLTQFHLRPDDVHPIFPPTGNFAGLNASVVFSRTRRSAGAISPEYGQRFVLSGSFRERWLGSDYRQYLFSTSAVHYQLMPWLKHHVLVLRGAITGGFNELATRPLTSLGGLPLRDPLRDLVFGTTVADSGIRGFQPGAFAGDFTYTATAEYRAPIWRIDRSFSTLPLYFRTFAGAAFVDIGNAGSLATVFRNIGVGVGAELRLDIDYGFLFGSTLRFGYARGLTQNGIDNVYFIISNGF